MCTCYPTPRLWRAQDGSWICSVCGKEPPPPAYPIAVFQAERVSDPGAADCACCELREVC